MVQALTAFCHLRPIHTAHVNGRWRPSTHVTAHWRIHTIYANVIC